jgi:hypothetical protein
VDAATVRAIDPGVFWTLCAILGAIGLYASYAALNRFRRLRLIQDTPTALIRSAPQSYVELRGMAELMAGDPIFAPASRRQCVWYDYAIHRRERRDDRWEWVKIEDGCSEELFLLSDTSGSCAVDPDGAVVLPHRDDTWYGRSRIPGRCTTRGALDYLGLHRTGTYRYRERLIEPGVPLYVIGKFITRRHGEMSGYDREAVAQLLRDWKRDKGMLLQRFDRDSNGHIDQQEWEGARAQAAREVRENAEDIAPPPAVDVIGATGDRHQPFMIAAGTEDEVIGRTRRATSVFAVVAVVALSVAIWLSQARVGLL